MLIPHMSLTVGLGGEAKVADFALEGLLSGVCPHVLEQGGLVPGGVVTCAHITLEWCHHQMLLVVTLEGPEVGKHSGAETTGELSFQLHFLEDRVIILLLASVV